MSRSLVVGGKDGHISPQDLFIGTQIVLNGHKFFIVSADEFTHHYMGKNAIEVNTFIVII